MQPLQDTWRKIPRDANFVGLPITRLLHCSFFTATQSRTCGEIREAYKYKKTNLPALGQRSSQTSNVVIGPYTSGLAVCVAVLFSLVVAHFTAAKVPQGLTLSRGVVVDVHPALVAHAAPFIRQMTVLLTLVLFS